MIMYFSSRIGRKILSIFILISIVSIIVISGLSIYQLKTVFTRKSAADYEKIAEELYYNINRLIIKGKTDINVVTRNPVIMSSYSTPDQKLSELQNLQETFKIYEDITIIDPKGLVVTSTHYSYRGDWRYKKHFLECLKGKTVVSNVQAIHSPEKYILDFTSPVYDDHGNITSVVAAQLDMKTMSDIITHVTIDETGHAFLLNQQFKIIAHRERDKIFLKPHVDLIAQIENHDSILNFKDSNGNRLVGACFDKSKLHRNIHTQDDTMDWIVVIVQDEKEMFSPLTDMIWRIAGYSIVIGCIVVILAIFFSRTITGPVETLTQGAEILGGGDLSHRVTVKTKDELQQLAQSFNLMAENLFDSRERLRQREADLKKAQNMAHLGSWEWNVVDGGLTISDEMCLILGIQDMGDHSGIMGLMEKIVHPDDRKAVFGQIEAALMLKSSDTLVYRVMREDGDIRWIEAKPPDVNRLTDDGKPLSLLGTIQDITARRIAEEELHQLRNYLASIIDSMPSVLIGVDAYGRITLWNSEAMRVTGLSFADAIGRPLEEAFPRLGPEMERVRDAMKTRDVRITTKQVHHRNNEIRYEDITVYPLVDEGIGGGVIRVDDVTEKVRLEGLVIQNEKMQSVGVLAAGIAHDFNNILAAIMGYTELAKLDSSEKPMTVKYLDHMLVASQRAKELVQQILEFSRLGKVEKRPVNIGSIVKEALKLLRASIPSTIEIRKTIESTIGSVEADPTQMHQIIMNLCTNAFHAMAKEGGILSVTLTAVEINAEVQPEHRNLKPGPYIQLTVTDTGHGMDAETQSRIFEPYFTTKRTGEGTGMGLATVHGIVKNHGGEITVYSNPGAGTTFYVLLPMVTKTTEKQIASPNNLTVGRERILLVDDEAFIVDIGQTMLTQLGYNVEIWTSSPDALKAFQSRPNHYDLIITDMTMPKMTGAALAAEIRKIRPDIPIIVCTGYSNPLMDENPEQMGINRILLKPLNLYELSTTIRQVLDDRPMV